MSVVRWAIVGCGVAGRARARALAERDDVTLVAVHRGRFADALGAPAVDEHEVLRGVDVVSISAPSPTHAGWVRRALEAGAHVVVDYPLAGSRREAEALLGLAAARGRMLHVEHIELLAPSTGFMVAQVGGAPAELTLRVTSPKGPLGSGAEHALRLHAPVHRLVAVGGPVRRLRVVRSDGEVLVAELELANGARATLRSELGAPARTQTWEARWGDRVAAVRDGVAWLDGREVTLRSARLFAEDTDRALARLRGEASPYVDDARLLHVAGVLDAMGSAGVTDDFP